MAAAIRLNYCGQLAPSHRYRNVRYASVPERMKRTTRGFLHLAERNKTNVVRLAHFFERPTNTHVTCLSLAAVGRPFKGCDGGGHRKAPGNCMTRSRAMCVITTILLMVKYPVLALCIQRTNDRRGSRQPTSFSLAMGGPNLLRTAVTGERPETLPSAKVSKWRLFAIKALATEGQFTNANAARDRTPPLL